jgi:four helix bundle protein
VRSGKCRGTSQTVRTCAALRRFAGHSITARWQGRCKGFCSMGRRPELLDRAYRFSLACLGFYRKLPKSPEAQVPGVQFYKAATSSWSNYRSTQRGRSRRDFVSKLGIVVEESDEALGWLEFMRDGQIASDPRLLEEAGTSYFLLFTFYFSLLPTHPRAVSAHRTSRAARASPVT